MAVYGDTSGILRGHAHAADQNIALEDDIGGIAYGDAHQLLGRVQQSFPCW